MWEIGSVVVVVAAGGVIGRACSSGSTGDGDRLREGVVRFVTVDNELDDCGHTWSQLRKSARMF